MGCWPCGVGAGWPRGVPVSRTWSRTPPEPLAARTAGGTRPFRHVGIGGATPGLPARIGGLALPLEPGVPRETMSGLLVPNEQGGGPWRIPQLLASAVLLRAWRAGTGLWGRAKGRSACSVSIPALRSRPRALPIGPESEVSSILFHVEHGAVLDCSRPNQHPRFRRMAVGLAVALPARLSLHTNP